MPRAVLTPRARAALREAVAWIARDSKAAARGLRTAVERALTNIGSNSGIAVERPELALPSIRFYVLSGYPYLLVYACDRDPPAVIRVLHGARDLPTALQDLAIPPNRRS